MEDHLQENITTPESRSTPPGRGADWTMESEGWLLRLWIAGHTVPEIIAIMSRGGTLKARSDKALRLRISQILANQPGMVARTRKDTGKCYIKIVTQTPPPDKALAVEVVQTTRSMLEAIMAGIKEIKYMNDPDGPRDALPGPVTLSGNEMLPASFLYIEKMGQGQNIAINGHQYRVTEFTDESVLLYPAEIVETEGEAND